MGGLISVAEDRMKFLSESISAEDLAQDLMIEKIMSCAISVHGGNKCVGDWDLRPGAIRPPYIIGLADAFLNNGDNCTPHLIELFGKYTEAIFQNTYTEDEIKKFVAVLKKEDIRVSAMHVALQSLDLDFFKDVLAHRKITTEDLNFNKENLMAAPSARRAAGGAKSMLCELGHILLRSEASYNIMGLLDKNALGIIDLLYKNVPEFGKEHLADAYFSIISHSVNDRRKNKLVFKISEKILNKDYVVNEHAMMDNLRALSVYYIAPSCNDKENNKQDMLSTSLHYYTLFCSFFGYNACLEEEEIAFMTKNIVWDGLLYGDENRQKYARDLFIFGVFPSDEKIEELFNKRSPLAIRAFGRKYPYTDVNSLPLKKVFMSDPEAALEMIKAGIDFEFLDVINILGELWETGSEHYTDMFDAISKRLEGQKFYERGHDLNHTIFLYAVMMNDKKLLARAMNEIDYTFGGVLYTLTDLFVKKEKTDICIARWIRANNPEMSAKELAAKYPEYKHVWCPNQQKAPKISGKKKVKHKERNMTGMTFFDTVAIPEEREAMAQTRHLIEKTDEPYTKNEDGKYPHEVTPHARIHKFITKNHPEVIQ